MPEGRDLSGWLPARIRLIINGIAFVNYLPKLINNHGEYETPE
jgi:hypothetical protein